MKMTIGNLLDKVELMTTIVREIESGGSVDRRANEIAELLDEYITILTNTKVDV